METNIDQIFKQIAAVLPKVSEREDDEFLSNEDGTEILCANEPEIDMLANLFDQLYGETMLEGTVTTGYYDPVEDDRNDEKDEYTGLYYVSIA